MVTSFYRIGGQPLIFSLQGDFSKDFSKDFSSRRFLRKEISLEEDISGRRFLFNKISQEEDVATETLLGSRPGRSLLLHSSLCRQVLTSFSFRFKNIKMSGLGQASDQQSFGVKHDSSNFICRVSIKVPTVFNQNLCSPFASPQVGLPASEQCDHRHHWLLPRLLPCIFQVCFNNIKLFV